MRRLFKKILFHVKLWDMDRQWRMMGGNCFALFPPSFYYTHTPEEVERITREEITEIRNILDEYKERNIGKGEV